MRYYKATFSDGHVAIKPVVRKWYGHAYRFVTATGDAHVGFSTDLYQCETNAKSQSAWSRKHHGKLQFCEIVETEVINGR